jgi:alkyl hydroperoxide reductase subunit AhpC
MTIRLCEEAPDFVAETTRGTVRFHEWKGARWAVLVSHPADFTPVCTTELAALVALAPEFARRETQIMVVSVDPIGLHYAWQSDVERLGGGPVTFPIAADPNRWVTRLYGMIHPACGRDAARSTFIVDPSHRVRLAQVYPPCTGRDFREVLRVIDSLQLADRCGIATPAGWQPGQDVIIPLEISNEEAKGRFPKGITERTRSLRTTPQPIE